MKLDGCLRHLTILVAGLAMGCGTTHMTTTAQGQVSRSPSVGTASLMTAELTDADDAPRVGKPQHSRVGTIDEETVKDAPRRVHRRGAGFSGYK